MIAWLESFWAWLRRFFRKRLAPVSNLRGKLIVNSIALTWKDPTTLSDDATAIPTGDFAYVDVQMSADQGKTFASLAHVAPGVQAYTVTNLVPGTYQFKVLSVDAQTPPLDSVPASLSVTIPEPALAPVTALAGVVQ